MPPEGGSRRQSRLLIVAEVISFVLGGDHIGREHRCQSFGEYFRFDLVVALVDGEELFDLVGELFRFGGNDLLAFFLGELNYPGGCSYHFCFSS